MGINNLKLLKNIIIKYITIYPNIKVSIPKVKNSISNSYVIEFFKSNTSSLN